MNNYLELINTNGFSLMFISEELKTYEMCLAAVNKTGNSLHFVPDKLKTPELCLAAVNNNGKALNFVPEGLKTLNICLAAVRSNGRAIKYVPEELRTKEIYCNVFLSTLSYDKIPIDYKKEISTDINLIKYIYSLQSPNTQLLSKSSQLTQLTHLTHLTTSKTYFNQIPKDITKYILFNYIVGFKLNETQIKKILDIKNFPLAFL